ncbi:hypothetical protein TSAR_003229 [Trichomalopsis sarcophagae]|uniref:DUF4794 domain-containing protein n=1 Tax=Trichomalopsis sarcophagae TaxID=543379 RepID=A0A232EUL5_9HYME|nr:hypothetical protein TSAR_003229 [Trichomalopsis sarcophagae]
MRLLLLISCIALSALLVSAKSESSSHPTKLSAVRASSSTSRISRRQDKRNLFQLGYGLQQHQQEPHQVYGPPPAQIPSPSEPEAAHRPPAPVFERPEPISLPVQPHPVSLGSFGPVVFPQHLGKFSLAISDAYLSVLTFLSKVPVAPGPLPPAFPVAHPVPVAPALPPLPIAAPVPVPAPAPIYIPVIQTVTKHVPVPVHVPKPYPVHVDRIVHVNKPYPVHVAVPVHVPKPYPVPVAIRTHYESLHRDW